tara:strand:- start:470 stop:1225 length:756 start_codon:yes stop_codon:yes gene_type:complete
LIKAKKSLGQNFLFDKNICKKIVNLSEINNNYILEIGPGTGYLTEQILQKNPKKLTIIEKDKELYKLLLNKFNNNKNLEIINCDALEYNYELNKGKCKIISNLPYNISIKLIINWIKMKNKFSELILMVQKEVAEKMNYNYVKKKNRLNFFMEMTCKYNIEFNVSKNVFFPKPKINSSVIKIIPKNNINININNLENFTKEIFKYKRKKLSNVINFKNNINKDLDNLIEKRAEDLKTNELIDIFNLYFNHQ